MTLQPMEEDREIAHKLWVELVNCMNTETKHAYKPGNEQCHEEGHIADVIASTRAEARKEVLESEEFKKVSALIYHEGCICPNHRQSDKHACPCTLKNLEIFDAFYDLEKFKGEALNDGKE